MVFENGVQTKKNHCRRREACSMSERSLTSFDLRVPDRRTLIEILLYKLSSVPSLVYCWKMTGNRGTWCNRATSSNLTRPILLSKQLADTTEKHPFKPTPWRTTTTTTSTQDPSRASTTTTPNANPSSRCEMHLAFRFSRVPSILLLVLVLLLLQSSADWRELQ